jgi:hypothetical protein
VIDTASDLGELNRGMRERIRMSRGLAPVKGEASKTKVGTRAGSAAKPKAKAKAKGRVKPKAKVKPKAAAKAQRTVH